MLSESELVLLLASDWLSESASVLLLVASDCLSEANLLDLLVKQTVSASDARLQPVDSLSESESSEEVLLLFE